MPTIKNKKYRQFLDTGEIEFITDDHIEKALKKINHTYKKEARVLLLLLYYTGARPSELLDMKGKSIWKENNDIKIKILGKKHGLPRTITISIRKKWMTEIYNYANNTFPELLLFPHFISDYNRVSSKGIKINENSSKLRYWIKIWFSFMDEVPNPYFFRHNRFSLISERGATLTDIKFLKGARTIKSVEPYTHMSTYRSKKLKKYF